MTSSQLDSAFQLQEHLKALHYHYSKPSDSESTVPISRETAILIATQPGGVDRALWLYELCRFLINKCNDLIIGFLFDDPPCSANTCPEMRASEWQFLCAVHESPKSCCAIDYCCHTLDWATNIVTSQKIFPSRLSLGAGDAGDDRGAGVKHLTNIFRRLHRIFAHAWFQHRGVFWQVEGQTGLYVLFKTVCDTYDLLPAENYKLPPEAEGLEPAEELRIPAFSIMKSAGAPLNSLGVEEDFISSVGRTNTRRHIRQSPSVGSAVTTVLEADEEESEVTSRLRGMQIAEEEGESEIPVIVETYEVDETRESGAKPEPEAAGQGAAHQEETKPSTEISIDPAKDELASEKAQEVATETESEAKPESQIESVLPSVKADAEPDENLEELERFSPELLKEEPKPDTTDIPHVEIAAVEEKKEKAEDS